MIGFNSNQTEAPNHLHQINPNPTDPNPQLPNSRTQSPPAQQPPPPQPTVKYLECLKNHAASVGGHVTDGCGEFMPDSQAALKCAACDCHRSFHRREAGEPPTPQPPSSSTVPTQYYPYNKLQHRATVGHLLPPHPLPVPFSAAPQHRRAAVPPVMMAFGSGAAAESSSEDIIHTNHLGAGGQSAPKKRFRTKFTTDQKEKMREFAERVGWKIQKQNENEVQHFCAEAGIKRQVFKVWMHNCNQASKKKQT